ncbi:UNVERIFIED_CONTAM: hypothetical protein Sradi_6778000 [Sesamum radiatum]|uniref:Uncharacterized protein n=1 Tax=Sesamum radiatum TaxID=300843 RepID=A0AAW2JRQ3_SESRA
MSSYPEQRCCERLLAALRGPASRGETRDPDEWFRRELVIGKLAECYLRSGLGHITMSL